MKSSETERLIEEVEKVISLKEAKSFAEIARSVGYKSQDFTDLKSGKKKMQRIFLDNLANKYSINKYYVLTGERHYMPEDNTFKSGEEINYQVNVGNTLQKIEAIAEVTLSAVADIMAKINDSSYTLVHSQLQDKVNGILRGMSKL